VGGVAFAALEPRLVFIMLEDVPTGVRPIEFKMDLHDQRASCGRNSSLHS